LQLSVTIPAKTRKLQTPGKKNNVKT